MEAAPQCIAAINNVPVSLQDSIRELRRRPGFSDLILLILTSSPEKYSKKRFLSPQVRVVPCDFDSPESISAAIAPYYGALLGVVYRGEKYIQDLRRLIPFLPQSILVSSADSLQAATNKYLMRTAFTRSYPQITPQFVEIHDDTDRTVEEVEAHVQYPVIVKPANLATSLMISACHSRDELRPTLTKIFREIHDVYRSEGRRDKPQVIVEEYLEGDFYSIDAYVMEPGRVYHCPPVAYTPMKQLKVDDFAVYKRSVPTELSADEVMAAQEVVTKAITAVGLTYTTVHAELVLTASGWKVIEIGPRVGKFRTDIYKWAYGIDHSMNDVFIHLGQKPIIPSRQRAYCAAYSIWPKREGTLMTIKGLEYVRISPLTRFLQIKAAPGDQCLYAKHCGHALAEFVIAGPDKRAFDELVSFIETDVEAVVT